MGISQVREVARADMNDQYGVTVWQEDELLELTVEEAVAFASEIIKAADEALRIRNEDDAVHASTGGFPHMLAESGEAVL